MTAAAPPRPRLFTGWRIAGWGTLAGLLVLPAVAMRYTAEVSWTAFDFGAAALLLGLLGAGVEAAVRFGRSAAHRAGLLLAAALGFITIWLNLAVGIIGDEEAPVNTGFFIIVAMVWGVAIATRLRPRAMAAITALAAVAPLMLGLATLWIMPGHAVEWGLLAGMTVLWTAAAALFHAAARET